MFQKRYKHLTFPHLIEQITEDYNLVLLGKGSRGYVFESNNTAIKVFENDPAYLTYLQYVKDNPNCHYPIVYQIKTIKPFYNTTSNNLTIVKMELLTCPDHSISELASEVVKAHTLNSKPTYLPLTRERNKKKLTLNELTYRYSWIPNLWTASRPLHKLGYCVDVHVNNILMRLDNTLVITDPLTTKTRGA